jgi:hypothetical protein
MRGGKTEERENCEKHSQKKKRIKKMSGRENRTEKWEERKMGERKMGEKMKIEKNMDEMRGDNGNRPANERLSPAITIHM